VHFFFVAKNSNKLQKISGVWKETSSGGLGVSSHLLNLEKN
jgi:hypothetical protein